MTILTLHQASSERNLSETAVQFDFRGVKEYHGSMNVTPLVMARKPRPQRQASTTSALLYSTTTGKKPVDKRESPSLESPGYPPLEHLWFFHDCFRKMRFEHAEDARQLNDAHGGSCTAFKCPTCGWWHNGRPKGDGHATRPSDLRRMWRKRDNKPALEELAEAYKNPKQAGVFFDPVKNAVQ